DRARIHDEEVLEPPRIGNVLVPGKDEIDARALEALDAVARVVDDVALTPRPRDREEVVMEHEDAQLVRPRLGELLLDPAVPPARSGSGRSRALRNGCRRCGRS